MIMPVMAVAMMATEDHTAKRQDIRSLNGRNSPQGRLLPFG